GQPRVRLHRVTVGVARLAAVRHQLPLPQPADRPARRRRAAGGPRRQRRQPRRRRAAGRHRGRVPRRAGRGQVRGPGHRRLRGDRPARPGAVVAVLVGRAGGRGVRAGQHPEGPRGLRRGQTRPAPVPVSSPHPGKERMPFTNGGTRMLSTRERARRPLVYAALLAVAALVLAACSSTGGKKAAEAASSNAGAAAGHANTPRYTIAMITHASPGDTFWDIIRAGATAAASKDNVSLHYSNADD